MTGRILTPPQRARLVAEREQRQAMAASIVKHVHVSEILAALDGDLAAVRAGNTSVPMLERLDVAARTLTLLRECGTLFLPDCPPDGSQEARP